MAKGSYNGLGLDVPNWLLAGVLALGGYFVYKTWIKPISGVTNAVGGAIEGGIDAVSGAAAAIKNIPSAVSSAVKTGASNAKDNLNNIINTVKTLNVKGTTPTAQNAGVVGYQPSDESLKAIGYLSAGQSSIPVDIPSFETYKTSGTTTTKASKSLNVKSSGKVISESTGTSSGKVFVTRADGSISSYQVNVGSGTGSSGSNSGSKSLNPQKGVTNISSNISAAQSSKQAINLTGLGKGARINLDTGNVSY